MAKVNLILSLCESGIAATGAGTRRCAPHRNPGSERYIADPPPGPLGNRDTKTTAVVAGGRTDRETLHPWMGGHCRTQGWIYAGEEIRVSLRCFPPGIPHVWECAEG